MRMLEQAAKHFVEGSMVGLPWCQLPAEEDKGVQWDRTFYWGTPPTLEAGH